MQMKLWLLDDIEEVLLPATELPTAAQNGNRQDLLKALARVTNIDFSARPSGYNLKQIQILPNVYAPAVKILRGPRSYCRSEFRIFI